MAIMVTAGMGIGTLTTMDMVGIMAEVDIIGADMAMAGIDERLSEGGKDSRSRNESFGSFCICERRHPAGPQKSFRPDHGPQRRDQELARIGRRAAPKLQPRRE